MPAIFKAAFIFVAPNADPSQDYSWVRTNEVHVKTVAVSNYQQACELIDALVEEGIKAAELCGGFGHQGVANVVKAANGRLHVGAVRFDNHPCLDFISGDALF
ncbi:hypothetical protein AB733_12100 [Photobacterium swingsii]|uniref:Uncharacterized protein n=1 Tax=Photobacterium swingsii TaxID=680026 RepID=A0A0J8VAC7_9GAMM|nr:DUF6506 family protein [Photobacterium swingsii]KMV30403.1 hypothetical protein AB733_12100 [Photobacterium swingsii]PSW24422.1 hypothetical protein C9I94_10285 [Photobacterium swingsii]